MSLFRHARKHFSQAEGGQLDEVRQVMGMLAFPPDTHISPYKVTSAPVICACWPLDSDVCGWARECCTAPGDPSAVISSNLIACSTQLCFSHFIPI